MIFVYILLLFLMGIYSYSQIDLNLTLLQTPWFLQFQSGMIQLGYYQRPLSTLIYLILLTLLFGLYIFLLRAPVRNIPLLVFGIVVVTFLTYPAFSHDFFNYIFDARIVTHYGQNPYFYKALDFPNDTWIRFMHWTHRTYPYGPLWLLLTVPFSYLGFGKFLLTLLSFRTLFIISYLSSIFLIKKILAKINPKLAMRGVIFFAANPLVIIESLISPHLDAVMATLFLLAVYLLVSGKRAFSIGALLISAGTKFLTIITLPLFFLSSISIKKLLWISLILVLAVLIPVIGSRESYPWYFLPPLAIIALLPESKKLIWLGVTASLGLLLRYAVFLYFGQEALLPENILTVVPVVLCALSFIFYQRQ